MAEPCWPSSLRDLVGSDEAMKIVLACLGSFGVEYDEWWLAEALALARMLPGVSVQGHVIVGPTGAKLLAADGCLGGLRLLEGSSYPHVLDALKVNTGLRKLDLRNCNLRSEVSENVALLGEALAVNASLEELHIDGHFLYKAGGCALARMLEANATLRVLGLRNCELGDAGAAEIGAALATNTVLQVLDLTNNGLGEASVRALAAALASRTTGLRKLELSDNGEKMARWGRNCLNMDPYQERLRGGLAVWPIFDTLRGNCTLVELHVSFFSPTKVNGAGFADMLRENGTLQVLDLDRNMLLINGSNTSSWSMVLAALQDNVGLRKLQVRGCGLTANDGQVLASALEERSAGILPELYVSNNVGLGDDACRAIVVACLKPGSPLRELNLTNTGLSCLRMVRPG